jgi:hypothetical protein
MKDISRTILDDIAYKQLGFCNSQLSYVNDIFVKHEESEENAWIVSCALC